MITRPINHPPRPNNYPRFRVDTIQNLEADLRAYPWTTTVDIPSDFFRVPQNQLTAWDALRRTLLELILNPPPLAGGGGGKRQHVLSLWDVQHYARRLRDRIYPEAREPLMDDLGRFCSYCEQKLTETIAVEHVAPKENYPLTSVAWSNFLLCCRSCNSYKDEQPARTEGWLPNGTEIDLYDAIRALPERQGEVVTLHYFADLSISVIAAQLGVSAGTVKSQLHDARLALRGDQHEQPE